MGEREREGEGDRERKEEEKEKREMRNAYFVSVEVDLKLVLHVSPGKVFRWLGLAGRQDTEIPPGSTASEHPVSQVGEKDGVGNPGRRAPVLKELGVGTSGREKGRGRSPL